MSDIWKKARALRAEMVREAARHLTFKDIKPGVQLMHTGRKAVEMVEVIEVLKERGMSGSMPTLVKVRGLESHKTYSTEVGRLRWPDEDELVARRGPRNTRASDEDPCWEGYEQVGMKDQDGKKVPNCVPKKEATATLAKRQKKASADTVFEIGQTHEGLVMSLRVTMSLPTKEMPYNQWHDSLLGAYGKAVRRWKLAERNGADRIPSLHSGEWIIWTHGGATHVGWEGYFDEGMEISDLRALGLLG